MEADKASSGQAAPTAQGTGGTVEPAHRATVDKEKHHAPQENQQERFELWDPFAEVTYRATTVDEMVKKAGELGSLRFTAVSPDGKRTPIVKAGSQWQRQEQLPARTERPLDPGPARGDLADIPAIAPKGSEQPEQADVKAAANNEAEAERAALMVRLEATLHERYIIKQAPISVGKVKIGHTEYRFRGDASRVAFTESTFRLATDTNSPSVAHSMVDVAQARNWKGLRVSGSEDFRRLVWLEASIRGVKAVGYEPNPADLDVLRQERQARMSNRIEPTHEASAETGAGSAEKSTGRGGGGRKAVIAAIEAVLVAKRVPEAQRSAVLAAAADRLALRTQAGEAAKVKVYDKSAQPQRASISRMQEQSRVRTRATPSHAR